jgi:rhamnulokinase
MVKNALRLLAIDLGAESGRAAVGAFDGERLSIDEVHRFANVPVKLGSTLYWDFLRLFGDVLDGIRRAGEVTSLGVDTWGVDVGLLDARGRLLGNPVHYRDTRTVGVMQQALQRVQRDEIYATTGIQFMEINTLYQLVAAADAGELERADRLLLMPDLINHFLCGSLVSEYTNATTTQCYDWRTRDWARSILTRLGISERILPDVVAPGTILGELRPDVSAEVGTPKLRVVAPATHDTASAVASIPFPDEDTAFLSSGTWSLIGLEVNQPVVDDAAMAANMTNEGGVAGTIRLLRNVMGLWLLQEARRALGAQYSYEQLVALAEQAQPFIASIDPDDERFLRPGDFAAAVSAFCQETQQRTPEGPSELVRVVLESLALKYAWVARQLAALSGRTLTSIYVVGGGARNELLCRLTAAATGLPVYAGAVEATTIGNLIVQALALGELRSLDEARELVARSFSARLFEPQGDWSEARHRFENVLRLSPAIEGVTP